MAASGGIAATLLEALPEPKYKKTGSVKADQLLKEAYFQALKTDSPYVGSEHFLLAILALSESKDYSRFRLDITKLNIFPTAFKPLEKLKKTPLLDTYGTNLNHSTVKNLGKPLVYRDVYESLVSALLLKTTQNVLLIGESGVGKKTLVELLARSATSLDIPPALVGTHVIEFDLMSFITNAFSKNSAAESVFAQLAEELKGLNRTILFIKNFQSLFFVSGAGISTPMFYSLFKNTTEQAGVRVIATMNSSIYDKVFSENDHLIDDFSVIEVFEPTEKENLKILESAAYDLAGLHNVSISKDVIKHILSKAKEYPGDTKFPKRGVELLDHCCSVAVLNKTKIPTDYRKLVDQSYEELAELDKALTAGNYDKALKIRTTLNKYEGLLTNRELKIFSAQKVVPLTVEDVDLAFETFKDDKPTKDSKTNTSKLATLADRVKKKIIGQDKATDSVVKALIRSRLGLRTKKRPLGNFLFLGPTGVGKTELAKVIADEFFGDKSLIRLDMSDFSEKHNVARLVGAPPGYVGYGEGGELTTKISTNPESLVLFDEIEKAHPDVLNILLQIMEEGELTDAKGTTFDFSKSVVILTSNLGTEILHNKGIGLEDRNWDYTKIEALLKDNAKKVIKPELLNRLDEVIIFNQLTQRDQTHVLELLLKDINSALEAQSIKLKLEPSVKELLLSKGYSVEFGARALRRTMERELLDVIAEFLLEDKSRPLALRATTDSKKEKVIVERVKA